MFMICRICVHFTSVFRQNDLSWHFSCMKYLKYWMLNVRHLANLIKGFYVGWKLRRPITFRFDVLLNKLNKYCRRFEKFWTGGLIICVQRSIRNQYICSSIDMARIKSIEEKENVRENLYWVVKMSKYLRFGQEISF